MKGIEPSSTKLLLVEGSHEVSFFNALLAHMPLTDVQVASVGGQSLFAPIIKNLPTYETFGIVESLGIVRDAEGDMQAKFNSIQGALADAGLPVPNEPLSPVHGPPTVTVFLMPDNQGNGALEDLCLSTVTNEPVMRCVIDYVACIGSLRGSPHPHQSKSSVQVYLASKDEGDIHMGIASEKGYWDFDSSSLGSLRSFLEQL